MAVISFYSEWSNYAIFLCRSLIDNMNTKDKNIKLKCYFFKNFFQKSGHPPPFSIYRCKYSFYALPFTACAGAGEI